MSKSKWWQIFHYYVISLSSVSNIKTQFLNRATVIWCLICRYTPLSHCRGHYQIKVELLDQEKKAICGYRPYKVFFHQGDNYQWCPVSRIILTVQLFHCNQNNSQSLTVPMFILLHFRWPMSLRIMDMGFGLSVSLMKECLDYNSLTAVWRSVQLQRGSAFQSVLFFLSFFFYFYIPKFNSLKSDLQVRNFNEF